MATAKVLETGSFVDERDKQKYLTVKTPDGRIWMAQNLNFDTKHHWDFDDAAYDTAKYGRLYPFDMLKKACPKDWRLPTKEDWGELITASGGWNTAGKILKAKNDWDGNGNGTDDLGFSALPGGFQIPIIGCYCVRAIGSWWAADDGGNGHCYQVIMGFKSDAVALESNGKDRGFSVRCVKDE